MLKPHQMAMVAHIDFAQAFSEKFHVVEVPAVEQTSHYRAYIVENLLRGRWAYASVGLPPGSYIYLFENHLDAVEFKLKFS